MSALWPKVSQLYAERSAGKNPNSVPVDISEQLLNDALGRLGAVDVTHPWWKQALLDLGEVVIKPDAFDKPHVREWISQSSVQSLLKTISRAYLAGSEDYQSDYEQLVQSYMAVSFEDRQHAESIVSIALVVIRASLLSAVRDPGAVAFVQATASDQRELLVEIKERLRPLRRADVDILSELSESNANLILDDIGGVHLKRDELLKILDSETVQTRLIQVRGLPGSGKSVLMKHAVKRALVHGPVLFLKAEQLEGSNWLSYAATLDLSGTSLEELLVEIGERGTEVLFIDAIDRIEKEHQPIVLDVIRAIVESPRLIRWRVVVSLRDTGIESLRNWCGEFLDALKTETLNVARLNDEEAETLALEKPHLKPLLFGSQQVQEIVRRPFFAKVLNQSYVVDAGNPTFEPQSEIDLIQNWWLRGGYDATGQKVFDRQRVLLDLARIRASQLSLPISLSQLFTVDHVDDLISDGILQHAREGVSVRFSHDIFFEWTFFYVLASRGHQWIDEIRACGEPPALARVVELTSQWEYAKGKDWKIHLTLIEKAKLRSQWIRAWLIGPFGNVLFESDEEQFAKTVFADDFLLFKKVLVWFQAEKTTPNMNVFNAEISLEKRLRFADLLGWPSDIRAWQRLIIFILKRISDIPQRLYPDVVAIFEVWQHAFAEHSNLISRKILERCVYWLISIDKLKMVDAPDENSKFWSGVSDLGAFRKSLCSLVLQASKSEPDLAAGYLQQVISARKIRDEIFYDVIGFTPTLAQALPNLVVDLSLKYLRDELPNDRVTREKKELNDLAARRKATLAKTEKERTPRETAALFGGFHFRTVGDFSHHDWEKLSLRGGMQNFWPASPLREPFHSLFKSAPSDALRLFRELCNHAMTSWKQLHSYSRHQKLTPLPFTLKFPWGTQEFWGSDREYLWFRSNFAPKVIASGFMALEAWCFDELERGRAVDDLIKQIVEGNECIAVLGVAGVLALQTQTVSQTTLPLVTSQRLLAADFERMRHDLSPTAKLIGFNHSVDKPHIEAVQISNARSIRSMQLSSMVPNFMFATGPLEEQARESILNFKNDLPYQFEEERIIPKAKEHLSAQASEYAELADLKNYQAYRTKEDPSQVEIFHVSPSAAEPQKVARVQEASQYLKISALWVWASKSLEEGVIQSTYAIQDAIEFAKNLDATELFVQQSNRKDEDSISIRRGAVAATASMVLNFRDGQTNQTLEWARDVLVRAIKFMDDPDDMWSPSAIIPWHPSIYVARGLGADIRHGTANSSGAHDLLELITHPLEIVSLTALEEACRLWEHDKKLTWAALVLALSLCHVSLSSDEQHSELSGITGTSKETQASIEASLAYYANGDGWMELRLPPLAWERVESGRSMRGMPIHEDYDQYDADEGAEFWREPNVLWDSKKASEILSRMPVVKILESSARSELLKFLTKALDWTIQKNAPPWVKVGSRHRSSSQIFEWTQTIGGRLGLIAGHLPLCEFRDQFFTPILEQKGDSCWALLGPFAKTYVCAHIYDSPIVPNDAVLILNLCLDRLLSDDVFKRSGYRSGEFTGFHLPELVPTLMFVGIEHADMAARYANGNWSEITLILPVIDRFIRAGGWVAPVMNSFLTLCERAKETYPAESFANQVLCVLADGPDGLKGWIGTFIPARIAELVQHFAHRDSPMNEVLAQKFLRILDELVDMGDRRSAALQLGEAFRETRLTH